MTKNPLINGLSAAGYIFIVAFVMSWLTRTIHGPDTFMAPIVVMSVFTLSAAVMGYLFCVEPIEMLIDGKKKQAVTLFLQTVFVFGIITVGFLLIFTARIL